ncbi:MAG TPA: DUF3089 domain-containing protein [Baekduia sp.]|nr:DUF3089 domain-containing protein [Baekduia sp.]
MQGPRRLRRLAASLVLVASAALATGAASAPASTTWLCRPGMAANPCTPGLATTQITPTGAAQGTTTPHVARRPKVDCFYVYPTVSDQPTMQATRHVDPEERSIALFQAARYSGECRVFAPMYRQITLKGLLQPQDVTAKMRATAYRDVRTAFRTYLKRYNRGHGIVFVSHSQGSYVLRQLLREEVDRKPRVRRRLVSALLLGGNVLVKDGRDVGGDFRHIRACRSSRQLGCVVAFSTFGGTPPDNAIFGTPSGRNAVSELGSGKDLAVLCVNPAALAGGSAPLDSVFPTAPFAPGTTIGALTTAVGFTVPTAGTPWVELPGGYTGQCTTGKVRALSITPQGGAPTLNALPDATWGLHLVDANIALGDLVRLVHAQAAAWARR